MRFRQSLIVLGIFQRCKHSLSQFANCRFAAAANTCLQAEKYYSLGPHSSGLRSFAWGDILAWPA